MSIFVYLFIWFLLWSRSISFPFVSFHCISLCFVACLWAIIHSCHLFVCSSIYLLMLCDGTCLLPSIFLSFSVSCTLSILPIKSQTSQLLQLLPIQIYLVASSLASCIKLSLFDSPPSLAPSWTTTGLTLGWELCLRFPAPPRVDGSWIEPWFSWIRFAFVRESASLDLRLSNILDEIRCGELGWIEGWDWWKWECECESECIYIWSDGFVFVWFRILRGQDGSIESGWVRQQWQ